MGGDNGESFGDSLEDSPFSMAAAAIPCRSRVEDAIRASERLSLMAGQGMLRRSATEDQKADAAALLADVLRAVFHVAQAHGISMEQSVGKRLRSMMMEFPPADSSLVNSISADSNHHHHHHNASSPIARQFHRMLGEESPQSRASPTSVTRCPPGGSSMSSTPLLDNDAAPVATIVAPTTSFPPPNVVVPATTTSTYCGAPSAAHGGHSDKRARSATLEASPHQTTPQNAEGESAALLSGQHVSNSAATCPAALHATPPLLHKTSSSSIESGGDRSSVRKATALANGGGGGGASLIYLVGRSPRHSEGGGDNPLGPGPLPHHHHHHHHSRRRAEGSSQPSSLSTPLSRNPSSSVTEYIDSVLMPGDSPTILGGLDDPVHAQYVREGSGGTLIPNNSMVAVSPMTPAELQRHSQGGDAQVPSSSITSLKQSYGDGMHAAGGAGGGSRGNAAAAPSTSPSSRSNVHAVLVPTVAANGSGGGGRPVRAAQVSTDSISANTSYEHLSKAPTDTNPLEYHSGSSGSPAASPKSSLGPAATCLMSTPNARNTITTTTTSGYAAAAAMRHSSNSGPHMPIPCLQQIAKNGRVVTSSPLGASTTTGLRVLYGIELLQEAVLMQP